MGISTTPNESRGSLPEDIAIAAGLPRGEEVSHSLHDVTNRVRNDAEDLADDVSDRAGDLKDRAGDTAQAIRDRAADAYDGAREWAVDARDNGRRRIENLSDRGSERFQDGKSAVEQFVSENPLLVGVVGLAAGLLLGALLPRTRREDETVGPWADEVREQGMRYARDITNRGREFVETALDPENLNAAAQHAGEPFAETAERMNRPH